ncbi:MAG: OmpA family protein [Cyclobacteriaceae bacterium]
MTVRLVTLFYLGFSVTGLFAQDENTVVASGKVLNADTKEPLVARITYQSLPYGNRMGVINNSSFSFPLFDGERYSITVEATGYASAKYMIDPAEASDGKIVKDIELHHTTGNVSKKHSAGTVMRLDNLIFEQAKSKIDPSSYEELDLLVAMMNEHKSMVIQLEGHTDYAGDPAKNLKLSQQRVDEVKEYLVKKGIKKDRVKTKAFGGTMPLSQENTPEARRLNRRVEVRILQN